MQLDGIDRSHLLMMTFECESHVRGVHMRRSAKCRFPQPFPQPRNEVIIPSACKNAQPKRQLRAIYNHAEDIQMWLEEHGYQRCQITHGI